MVTPGLKIDDSESPLFMNDDFLERSLLRPQLEFREMELFAGGLGGYSDDCSADALDGCIPKLSGIYLAGSFGWKHRAITELVDGRKNRPPGQEGQSEHEPKTPSSYLAQVL